MQNQSRPELTFFEKMEVAKWLCKFPALTVMLMLRRNLGYRIVGPGALLVVFLVMVGLSEWASAETPNAEGLFVFALAVLVTGFAQRAKRKLEVRDGELSHTYYIGDSDLQRLPWPRFMRAERRIERFLDPLVCLLIGFSVGKYFSPALGCWIFCSGLCLRIFEAEIHKREVKRELDILDGMVESEMQAEAVNRLSVRIEQLEKQASQTSSGIPTGYGPDIQSAIHRRLRRDSRKDG